MIRHLGMAVFSLQAFKRNDPVSCLKVILTEIEGIIPALETAHGLAYAGKAAAEMGRDEIVLVKSGISPNVRLLMGTDWTL